MKSIEPFFCDLFAWHYLKRSLLVQSEIFAIRYHRFFLVSYFGQNLQAFQDAISGGGPGFPGDCMIEIIGSAQLQEIFGQEGFDVILRLLREADFVELIVEKSNPDGPSWAHEKSDTERKNLMRCNSSCLTPFFLLEQYFLSFKTLPDETSYRPYSIRNQFIDQLSSASARVPASWTWNIRQSKRDPPAWYFSFQQPWCGRSQNQKL